MAFGCVLQGDVSFYQPEGKPRKVEEKSKRPVDTCWTRGGRHGRQTRLTGRLNGLDLSSEPRRVSAISTMGARTVQKLNRVWSFERRGVTTTRARDALPRCPVVRRRISVGFQGMVSLVGISLGGDLSANERTIVVLLVCGCKLWQRSRNAEV